MKDKNIYKEAQYGRKQLMGVAIAMLVISLIGMGVGIFLVIKGATSAETASIVWKCVVGGLLTLLGLAFTIFAFIMLFTSLSMIKVERGSVKDGNRAIGTANIVKCDKCGEELPETATFCSKCGSAVDGRKVCECQTINSADAEYCVKCGKKLN